MYHDGNKMRIAPSFGWRNAQEGDVDDDGRQVESNYVVIVKVNTCETVQRNGRSYYKGETGKQVVIGHGGTYYGYEKKHHNVNDGDFRWVRDQEARKSNYHEGTNLPEEVWTNKYCWYRKFMVKDARVYTCRFYRLQGQ